MYGIPSSFSWFNSSLLTLVKRMSMVVDTCEVFCLFDSYIINGASHVLGFGWCDELVNQQWKTKSLGTMACDYAFTSLLFCVCTCVCVLVLIWLCVKDLKVKDIYIHIIHLIMGWFHLKWVGVLKILIFKIFLIYFDICLPVCLIF